MKVILIEKYDSETFIKEINETISNLPKDTKVVDIKYTHELHYEGIQIIKNYSALILIEENIK